MVVAARLPRRKKRTAGATPAREAKKRGGQARSVLEALLAGDEDEDTGDRRVPDSGFSRRTGGEHERTALGRKRQRKERQKMKKRAASAGERVEGERNKENVPLGGGNQEGVSPRVSIDAKAGGADINATQGDSDNGASGGGDTGSPVVQKRLFSSNQSTSSGTSDAESEPAEEPTEEPTEEPAVDAAEEQRNYHRFVSKYAMGTTASVLEAVTPRDERKKAKRAAASVPSPVHEADESTLSQDSGTGIQYRNTDDESDDEDWQVEMILQDDDDKRDPTYDPADASQRRSPRSSTKKSRVKTTKAVEADRKTSGGGRPVCDDPTAAVDESSDTKLPLRPEKRRKWARSTVLSNWSVEWPLQTSSASDRKSRGLRLALLGQVDGKSARFEVAKRFTATHFTSSTGVSVFLDGPLKADADGPNELPPEFVELMSNGIPAHWKSHLAPFVPGRLPPPAKRKLKRTTEEGLQTPKDAKSARIGSVSKESIQPMTPTMKWWTDDNVTMKSSSSAVKQAAATRKPIQQTSEKKAAARKPPRSKRSAPAAGKSKKESDVEADDWTAEQLEALDDAKLKIPTTAANFWAEVATFVPGKTSGQCRARSFALYSTPPERKSGKAKKRALDASESRVPNKVARAGSNKFKKQVREFVEEYEKKNADDIFADQETPVKAPALSMDFDSLTSPTIVTPQKTGSSERDGDDSDDAPTPGLLTKLTASKRDDVDSYVLGIKRRHTGMAIGAKAVRTSGLSTPTVAATKKKGKAVHVMTEVGTHLLEGVVSPGGTTRVRIEKDGSSSDEDDVDEEDDDERSDLSDF